MKELLSFIDASPTAFHCVESVRKMLEEKGFKELKETEDWKLKKGDKFYVKRNGSSIIAFNLPKTGFKGFHIYSAHSDSPSFRIKENTEMVFENNYVRLNVEKYGGMIMASWYDRPLSVAGRVVV
ncbi:MAG: M18 family aminopeptidase, partial [Lachnospiraceae bacterium]|nr:M18 family aminopeptidase [Lachnospiraceae bacterium]